MKNSFPIIITQKALKYKNKGLDSPGRMKYAVTRSVIENSIADPTN